MANTVKLSDAASIAIHSMVFIAKNNISSVGEISSRLKISEAHLSKVMQRLTKSGLIKSIRGPRGGYMLSKPGSSITLQDVYEAIEGPINIKKCLMEGPGCNSNKCIFGDTLIKMGTLFKEHLRKTKLSEISDIYNGGQYGR